ncbi:MAG TPA: outer membrane protein assembly factor BamD [Pyrinomonadaceae bacterium]|nr:outer membrane protein assembly factor BamD [Pyrinomonadaceae bacterium]
MFNRNYLLIATLLFLGVTSITAQRNVTRAIDRDPVMEADAKHNLDVAWQSYRLKKAYKGVIMRFEETYAAYPTFSKIDEFLYLAGMSSWYLSENKGKQKVDLKLEKEKEKFAPAKLKEDAIAYLSIIADKYPQSDYATEAQKALAEIKGQKHDR